MATDLVIVGRTRRAVPRHDKVTRATMNRDGETPALSPTTTTGDAETFQSSSG